MVGSVYDTIEVSGGIRWQFLNFQMKSVLNTFLKRENKSQKYADD